MGEESGNLERVFNEIANRSRDDFESWTQKMTTLLEPLMILFMGGFVGGVVDDCTARVISVHVSARYAYRRCPELIDIGLCWLASRPRLGYSERVLVVDHALLLAELGHVACVCAEHGGHRGCECLVEHHVAPDYDVFDHCAVGLLT